MEFSQAADKALAGLTEKQRRFCLEYIKDSNATQAAIRSGYAITSADTTGSKLLKHSKVDAAISALQSHFVKKTGITAERVLGRINAVAKSTITQVIEWDEGGVTKITPSKKLPKSVALAIKSFKCKPIYGKEGNLLDHEFTVVMHDSLRANQMLGQHLGLFGDYDKALATLSQFGEIRRTANGFEFSEGEAIDVEGYAA